ncbi:MAG: hypothetical protein KAS13_04425 [Candidatus Omnitrophica bacterium]|nr:hypothetical protein [Candidatus Omnitrophota bacterium]
MKTPPTQPLTSLTKDVKGGAFNHKFFFRHWCIVLGRIIGIIWFELNIDEQPKK